MKKYIVFQYDLYYQTGGLSDVSGDFDTFKEAKALIEKNHHDFNKIIDRDTWEVVYST